MKLTLFNSGDRDERGRDLEKLEFGESDWPLCCHLSVIFEVEFLARQRVTALSVVSDDVSDDNDHFLSSDDPCLGETGDVIPPWGLSTLLNLAVKREILSLFRRFCSPISFTLFNDIVDED